MTRYPLLLLGSLLCAWQAAAAELPPDGWKFSNGPEFPGAAGTLRCDDKIPFNGKKSLELAGDFSRGGGYVAAGHTLEPAAELREFQFKIKGDAARAAVRFVDTDGQTHQHFLPLTGNPSVWQCIEVPVAGSPGHHWGGKNDGVLRGPVRRIAVVLHRNDFPGKTGSVRLADFRTVETRRLMQPLPLPAAAEAWKLNRGLEFAPGADASLDADGKRLLLKVDNSRHGDYAAAEYRFKAPVNAKRLSFEMRGANRNFAVRFIDAGGQFHNHLFKASGNPGETQKFAFDVAGSEHHWSGENDGVFHGPLAGIQLVVCGKFYGPEKKGETEFRNLSVEADDPAAGLPAWEAADPAALFRRTGDTSPVQLQARLPEPPQPEQLRYSYRGYDGGEVAAGTAVYDAAGRTLSAPPPPGRGFFELCYPELGIRLGLAVDDPPPAEIDEYFAQDSSLSWGPPPDDEKGIRDFMRILKKNGICWNRDRLHWPGIEKERGKFDFGGRFGLYRRIAEEEGIKALDTFHAAPPWNSESPTRFRDADPRRNLYPVNLLAAGESWSAIVRHWGALKALEVWNEPDISFGNAFPAEYVTAFTKAVSRSFADNGIDALVVGGVFASTRPGTNFYRTYIDNGLLDDSDVISYHSYAEVPDMEPQVAALRQAELDSGTPRAGIPYWITECGKPRPWTGTSRGPAEPDLYSAAEITGKAAELRALGLERYFAFEYKFRRENANNFGQMDANRTPMRGMAAYLHLVRVLSHRDYVGDLKGSDALRSRVFEGKDDLVAVLYNGTRKNRKSSVSLPSGLGVLRATGIDGRPVEFRNGRVPNTDGITYVYLDKAAKQNFIDPGTRAMELCRLAKSYRPRPRAAKPLVLQPLTDLSKLIVTNRGFYVPESGDLELKLRINNFGKTPLEFAPEIELPPGAELLTQPAAVTVPAGGTAETAFRASLAPDPKKADFQTLRVGDRNGNATPIAFSFAPFRQQELVLEAMPDGTRSPATPAELEALGNWNDFSGPANWTPWEGDKTVPDIEARLRGFYTPRELVFQVLVRDERHVNANSAFESWRGDSVQLTVQQRKADKLPLGRRQYHEITAAKCGEGQTLYAHIGTPTGKLAGSKLDFRAVGDGWYLYEIRLNGKELGLELKPGSVIGSSLIVNSDPGTGRAGFLNWGLGIAPEKSDTLFQLLVLK